MTKISELMIRVILDKPVEVPDDQVAEVCKDLAWGLMISSDMDYEIGDHLKKFGSDNYPLKEVIVWSHQEKYEQD